LVDVSELGDTMKAPVVFLDQRNGSASRSPKAAPPKLEHVLSIANSDQCCYCGACLGVCPGGSDRNLVIKDFESRGWTLRINDESKCGTCTLCIDACPMHEVDYQEVDNQVFPEKTELQHDHLLGYFLETVIGYSTNEEMRMRGASGGLIGETVAYLFESNKIDGVVTLKPGGNGPLDYKAFIAKNFDEYHGAQGSHYFPLPAMDALSQVMSGKFRSVLVIGIPCQVLGLQLGRRRMRKLQNRIFAVLGSFCGGTTTFKLLDYLVSRLPLEKRDQIKTVRFRGGHWPGNIKVELKDGTIETLPGIERDFHQFTALLPACMFCADHFNEYADISYGDPWLEDILARKDGGYSVVIVRTERGMQILEGLRDACRIKTEPIAHQRVVESQRGPMDFKKRGLKPRLALGSMFTAQVPKIKSARLMKNDLLDYINAFTMLLMVRLAKYRWYWKFFCASPSGIVRLLNKPVYVLQKRNNLGQRIIRKSVSMLGGSPELSARAIAAFQRCAYYGVSGILERIMRRVWWALSVHIDTALFEVRYWLASAQAPKEAVWLPVEKIDSYKEDDLVVGAIRRMADDWMQNASPWNEDTYSGHSFPALVPSRLGKWITAQPVPRPDFMVPNERTKLNCLPSLAIAYRLTGEERYLAYLQQELETWRHQFPLGKGVAYFTTLNVAQRLINLCIMQGLLGELPAYRQRLAAWVQHQAYLEYQYIKKYNTSYYAKRNNFYICELASSLLFLRTFGQGALSPTEQHIRAKLAQEVKLQVGEHGGTQEGSMGYSRFICELLFLAVRAGCDDLKPSLRALGQWLENAADHNGLLAPFGDVSCERGFQMVRDENILNAGECFDLLSRLFDEGGNSTAQSFFSIAALLFFGDRWVTGREEKAMRDLVLMPEYIAAERSWGKLVIDTDGLAVGSGVHAHCFHAHCDQGSFVLFSQGLLVSDPGTISYFADPIQRNTYRASARHNVSTPGDGEVCILGPGLFECRDSGRVIKRVYSPDKFTLNLPGFLINGRRYPVQRTFELSMHGFTIEDTFDGLEQVVSRLHLAPMVQAQVLSDTLVELRMDAQFWALSLESEGKIYLSSYVHSSHYREEQTAACVDLKVPNGVHILRYRVEKKAKSDLGEER
jgi:coenzyme F420 hydrogenase subunit beta